MENTLTDVGLPKTLACDSENSCHGIKDICVDEGINSVHKPSTVTMIEDVKVHSSPHLVEEYFTNEIRPSGSLQPIPAWKPSSETTEYSSGSSLGVHWSILHGTPHDVANVKRIDENLGRSPESERHQSPGPIDANTKNMKPVSLAHLLQEDRNNSGFSFEQASESKVLIPLEEFNRWQCSPHSSASDSHVDPSHRVNNNAPVKPADELSSLHINTNWEKADEVLNYQLFQSLPFLFDHHVYFISMHPFAITFIAPLFLKCNGFSNIRSQGALIEKNSSASAVSHEQLKGGNEAEAYDIGSVPPPSSKGTKGAAPELEQSSVHTTGTTLGGKSGDGSASLVWTAFNHASHSESNVLGSASFSHQIIYSGQAPYSGNVSLRSDSSTTSTRSFAFPVYAFFRHIFIFPVQVYGTHFFLKL